MFEHSRLRPRQKCFLCLPATQKQCTRDLSWVNVPLLPRIPRTLFFPPRSEAGRGGRGGKSRPTAHAARGGAPSGPDPGVAAWAARARRDGRGAGLPLQLLLLRNLQPRAPAALGLLRHFGAHDLPALFGERDGRRVTDGLGVELPAGAPGTRRLRRWRWRPERLQGRAAGLAGAPGPLGGGSRGGAAGGPGARRAAAVPGVERDVEGPRARGPTQGQRSRRQAGPRAHHVRDPAHPAVRGGREQPCPEQEPPPEPGPRHRGPEPVSPAPAPGRAARPVRPPARVQAPPENCREPGKGGEEATSVAGEEVLRTAERPQTPTESGGEEGAGVGVGSAEPRREGRGEGSGLRKVKVRGPSRGAGGAAPGTR